MELTFNRNNSKVFLSLRVAKENDCLHSKWLVYRVTGLVPDNTKNARFWHFLKTLWPFCHIDVMEH